MQALSPSMKVEIWSDVVCPWCYIGKRRFEQALLGFAHREEVEVVWRSFELDPAAPASRDGSYAERLADKYGTSVSEAQQMIDSMTAAAAAEGLDFHFEVARPGNTFDAHRLLHLAAARGVQDAVKERLVHATFTEGEPISDHETLVRLVAEAGLDAGQAAAVLAGDDYAKDVRADEREARELRITGVPCFVIDRRYAVSGAQPAELLQRALERAWQDRTTMTLGHGPAGEPAGTVQGDSCAV